ncbi:MAG: hypothetical protein LBV20_05000 [Treponema sp.]|jgi:hypothetical protein|nr:hypothetical protein [Treponema sp.]
MDSIPAIIFGPLFIFIGIMVFNGKLLRLFTFKNKKLVDESNDQAKKLYHRLNGIIIIVIGVCMLISGIYLLHKGIITTKQNFLY